MSKKFKSFICVLLTLVSMTVLCSCSLGDSTDNSPVIHDLNVKISGGAAGANFSFSGIETETKTEAEKLIIGAGDVITVTVEFDIPSDERDQREGYNKYANYQFQAAYPYTVTNGKSSTLTFQLQSKTSGRVYQKVIEFTASDDLTIDLGDGNGFLIKPEIESTSDGGGRRMQFCFYCNSPDSARVVEGKASVNRDTYVEYLIGVNTKAADYASEWCDDCGHEAESAYCNEYLDYLFSHNRMDEYYQLLSERYGSEEAGGSAAASANPEPTSTTEQ